MLEKYLSITYIHEYYFSFYRFLRPLISRPVPLNRTLRLLTRRSSTVGYVNLGNHLLFSVHHLRNVYKHVCTVT